MSWQSSLEERDRTLHTLQLHPTPLHLPQEGRFLEQHSVLGPAFGISALPDLGGWVAWVPVCIASLPAASLSRQGRRRPGPCECHGGGKAPPQAVTPASAAAA